MSNFGFGFHGPDDESDDDRHRDGDSGRGGDNGNNDGNGNNNDPFGFGANPFGFLFGQPGGGQGGQGGQQGPGLGDILGQFGAMLSGFGKDMNSPDAQGPVNYALAGRIARQQITGAAARGTTTHDSQAVAESVRLAELWLDDATVLPAGATASVSFSPERWLEETMPTWKRIIDPLADKLGDAALAGLPEEARAQLGPMKGIISQVNGMNFGMQLGKALGELSKEVVTSTQWGIPLAQGTVAAVATGRLDKLAEKLGAERRETLIYLAAREAATLRLFQHVPWLVERLILDVEEFASGLALDNSAMEEAMRSFDPESMNDPAKMQEMMQSLQNSDLAPKIVSSTEHARTRLVTSLSLVEGWVDVVVAEGLASRLPATNSIGAAWSMYRDSQQPGMKLLSETVGIDLNAAKASQAAELWSRLTTAVGKERRDAVWNHPDFLPVDSDLDSPAEFIDSILGESDSGDFDPISEIEKLERELNKGDDDSGDDGKGDDDKGDDDNR
jgi:putative hydrolase